MGAGIAVEFKARFPKMFDEYKRRCADGQFLPGDVFAWAEGDVTIYNLGTQKTWRTRATLSAIEKSVIQMVRLAEQAGTLRIGLPKIGAGLGGLDWAKVKKLLERIGESTTVTLRVFEEYAPTK
jgi:O-acetyl-ADP-ribose deacetylase (regulator of RNase III)